MEIVKFVESILAVIIFGFIQHNNVIKINNLYARIFIALAIFSQFDFIRCVFLYACGFDYALFVLFRYNTKGIGLNTFYPEVFKPDRFIIYLINRFFLNISVTFTSLFDLYIVSSVFIIIHFIYLFLQCL